MTTKIARSTRLVALAVLGLTLAALAAPAPCAAEDIQITIEIAPSNLNLASGVRVVTVHTDIPYAEVDGDSVVLFYGDQGVPIASWKADDCGNFVAKFLVDHIRILDGLVIPGVNAFELEGLTWDLRNFLGSDEIMVTDGGARRGSERS